MHHDYVDGEINNSLWDRGQEAAGGHGHRALSVMEEDRGEEASLHRNRSDVTNLRRGLCRDSPWCFCHSLACVFASVVGQLLESIIFILFPDIARVVE